jgi:streptomycin 6-kinase
LRLPPGLDWLRATKDGSAWLAEVPRLVQECAEQWSLRLDEPFPYAYASVALPAVRADGSDAVLKVGFPDRENEHEGDALAAWDGNGAVRLLERDRARRALLIERCRPGTSLAEVEPEKALALVLGLLPRLWLPGLAEPFRPLAEEAAWWASRMRDRWEAAGRPFERSLVDAAVGALEELAPSQGEQVLLSQDLHGGNVLRAEREPWLAIDPKPLVGEREFGIAPLVRSVELGHSRRHVLSRLDRLTAELGLDPERARLWTVGQTIAWSVGSDYPETHVETVRWLLERRPGRGRSELGSNVPRETTLPEPSTGALDEDLPAGVNQQAPIVGASEIEIDASPEAVWEVLTAFERWPSWNRAVKSMTMQGDVARGSVFRWKAGPGTITSTLQRVERPRLIAWTGKTLGINAIHFWYLEPRDGKTFVRTEESYEGLVARVFRGPLQKTLDRALADGLADLKTEVERRGLGPTQG